MTWPIIEAWTIRTDDEHGQAVFRGGPWTICLEVGNIKALSDDAARQSLLDHGTDLIMSRVEANRIGSSY